MKAFFCLMLLGAPLSFCALADQNDARLETLFEALRMDSDIAKLRRIEGEIWTIWLDSGRADVNTLVDAGTRAMQLRRYGTALEIFNRVVEMAPEFAEGWNKRATVHYLRDELFESVRDIQRTLRLEPRHFGALSGMGLIFTELGDEQGALEVYEEVIKIHPNSPNIRANIEALRAKIRGRAI
jgi:tetratricopeptide (TPR) repeat protein